LEAFFFGYSDRQLYGVFHEATGSGNHGVVLANPGPQESMQTHYAYRVLAKQLTHAGCSVLRFDWTGTGDSAGESDCVSLQQCRDDLLMAVQELKDISNPRRTSVIGYRLGATVAASTPFTQPLENLVLWEPVISGQYYLDELRARERRKFGDLLEPPTWWRTNRANELLGYAMSRAHYAELEKLDLVKQATPSARRVIIIAGKKGVKVQALVDSFKERRVDTSYDEFDNEGGAQLRDDGMLLAGVTTARIADFFPGV
jgi:pimeloyl-ACP methyl ester carboxylesterase